MTSDTAALTLENLTLQNAKTTAGGQFNDCSKTAGQGGAICAQGGALTLTNSTVSGNTAGVGTTGGGIYSVGTVTLTSSILAGNALGGTAGTSGQATGGTADDCWMNRGSATGSNNLIQATAKACGLTHGTNNNIVGQDPLLATLADNGCATPAGGACVRTHALGAGSPALDAGSNPNNLTTDQRDYGLRVVGAAADIGAFEVGASAPPTTGAGSVVNQTATVNQLFSLTTPTDLFADDSGVAALALTASGLPAGLTATDNGNGTLTISGTPTQAGTFTVTIEATDASGQKATQTFSITVNPVNGLMVTGAGSGNGTVTATGIDCTITAGTPSGTCTTTLDHGTTVSLTATVSSGSTFGGWSDASCGTANPCSLTLTAAQSLTATFTQQTTTTGTTTTTPTTTGAGGTTSTGDTTTGGNCRATAITCSDSAKLWIHRTYRGYYGRCAECGGFHYWCRRLDAEGGGTDLSPIIAAFGTSREYTNRFSGLSDAELIHNLYRNMFDRTAEPGGLAFYLELLEAYRAEWRDTHDGDDQGATEYGLSRIALDILLGAQGNDINILDAKLADCEQF